jgi:hypothetical protein
MPKPFPSLRSMGSRKFKPRATIGFILVFMTLGFGLSLVFYHTSKRQSSQVVHLKKSTALNAKKLSDLKAQVTKRVTNPFVPDEWCEARDYIDLSSEPVFADFNLWMSDYQKVICLLDDNCTKHDPRKILKFLKIGEKLAIERKKVFEKIMRGDPQKAILMALPQEITDGLPESISSNLESWKSERINLDSIHVCYDPNHPEGLIKHWAILEDGKKYRVWSHGKRKKIQTVRGIASWGISLGKDFAMSSHSYRDVKTPNGKNAIEFAGKTLGYENNFERDLFIEEIEKAESEISILKKTVSYPIMAGSSSLSDYYKKKYDLVSTPMTWKAAKSRARQLNGRLVVIQSQREQDFVFNQYKDGALGFDPNGNPVKYGWLGATDSIDQNGSSYDLDTNTTSIFDLNATEGDWKWLSGEDVNQTGFSKWEGGTEPNDALNIDRNFSAMDWNSTDGFWVDINGSYELPFLVEYNLGSEPATIDIPIKGFRKVLIVPARFQDEGWGYEGSSAPLTDQFGNTLYPDLQKNTFEPVSQESLARSMERVVEYFRENSDGAFNLIPVISPTVTIPLNKYDYGQNWAEGESNPYDSNGVLIGIEDHKHEELPDIGDAAILAAAEVSEKYDVAEIGPNGVEFLPSHFFWGIQQISTSTSFGSGYKAPPSVTFKGGNIGGPNGLVHPDFLPCQARAIVNGNGNITGIEILDPGQYYYSNPTVFINGSDIFNGTDINATAGNIAVSWVAITTHEPGAAGLGYVGGAGSHVDAVDGNAGWGVIAHELGHNFGLFHANRFISRSERPNSDEGEPIDYGNPYAVMGSGSGHMTVPAKVAMRANGFGYVASTTTGSDVADLTTRNRLQTAVSNNLHETESDHNNTFRIYRHDYKDAPLSLIEQTYGVNLPESVFNANLIDVNKIYGMKILGTGGGVSAVLETDTSIEGSHNLIISKGGKGFVEEPQLEVLNDTNETILRIDASWIRVATGTESSEQAVLRNVSEGSARGLRGALLRASPISPIGEDLETNMFLMWLEYRREASEYGLSVLIGGGVAENYWIDMTPTSRDDFSDAFLMPGQTFSDYSTDTHITSVAKGGVPPMEYLDVVVHVGSVAEGEATAPSISLDISNQNPFVGEFVTVTARVNDGNSSNYSYSWFTNEKMETSPETLNQPTLYKSFSEAGEYVVRLVVSDMKGGISSRNVVFKVGDYEQSSHSSISGTVRSSDGFIQGARVEISPAEIIEHKISVTGNPRDLFLPTGTNNPLSYTIDGNKSPDLIFNRGEIHRFIFDAKADELPLSFFEHAENELPKIRLNMLVLPFVDIVGDNFIAPPEISLVGGSAHSSYFSDQVGTIADFQNGLIGDAAKPLVVTRPYAKALLSDTNITGVRIRPTEFNNLGLYVAYGGKGHHRENPPNATVHRTSFWEDYNDTNATVKAYVDGVGTISPVNALSSLGSVWETRNINNPTPKVVVWGTGSEHNATVETFDASKNQISIAIHNQGAGFEPNATMAVLHYPHDPMAIWTFDLHESLYDDATESRFQPSPAWNRDLNIGLVNYWKFDEENGTTLIDSAPSGNGSNITDVLELSELSRSQWGVTGRSVHVLDSFSNPLLSGISTVNASNSYTLSLWVKPDQVDSTITVAGNAISYVSTTDPQTFAIGGISLNRLSTSTAWSHIAVVALSGTDGHFYIDGQKSNSFAPGNGVIFDEAFEGLLDEVRVYSRVLPEAQIRYLAGRSFLDISGNKYHAVPVGPDFTMSSSSNDVGSKTDRPQDSSSNKTPGKLGDSYAGENQGRSVFWDDNDSYIDLSTHASEFKGINQGSISFWIRTSGMNSSGDDIDQTVFCASDVDDNQSFLRIMVRDIGVMQLHAVNDGTEVSKFYTDSNDKITYGASAATANDWHHVVLVVDDIRSAFWIDGQLATSMTYGEGAGDNRAFFSDIENIDFMGIGLHRDANFTNSFTGNLDDFHIYDRPLDASEISYLYELRKGREQIPRLQALVDAVGTVTILNEGVGYKELPEVEFSYGQDGNKTVDLTLIGDALNPDFGDIVYDDGESIVKSRYVGYTGDHPSDWREYDRAFGTAELNGTSIDKILWTKDTFTANILQLPNDRNVTRRYVEYVQEGNGSFAAPSVEDMGAPAGLFGYTAPPDFLVTASDSGNPQDDATGYSLFFLDRNHSAEIISKGSGLVDFSADAAEVVRISGKGFRPEQVYRMPVSSFEETQFDSLTNEESAFVTIASTQVEQPWRLNPNNGGSLFYGSQDPRNGTILAEIQNQTWHEFGENNEYLFGDWTHQANDGEPRDVTLEFSDYISSIEITDQGYGYSVPAEALAVGGYPTPENLQNWVDANPGVAITFIEAELNVTQINATTGAIQNIAIVNGGRGYEVAPEIMITGGGGHGAVATSAIDENGTIVAVLVENGGRGYFNLGSSISTTIAVDGGRALTGNEEDANVTVLLGGHLHGVGICPCAEEYPNWPNQAPHAHLDPWIEIWDRNRSEAEIDSRGDRAMAAAKVRNGVIEKIVVVNSGRGYVDPVIYVRGSPPNRTTGLGPYNTNPSDFFSYNQANGFRVRIWRCTNLRETKDGSIEICGHTQGGNYPPEVCPGETDDSFTATMEATPEAINAWRIDRHKDCTHDGYPAVSHLGVNFQSRVCSGTKANYVLLNDPYRVPYENWTVFDANLTALVSNGKISEIKVENGGQMYVASDVRVAGTGSGVDIIPIYDEDGFNTQIIFDDPNLRNLETDYIPRPMGAGQGFQERPWSLDDSFVPTNGLREAPTLHHYIPLVDDFDEQVAVFEADFPFYRNPVLESAHGDRVSEVRINESGSFNANTPITINLDFDGNHRPDLNLDGQPDFVPASVDVTVTTGLSGFILDENGTFEETHDVNGDDVDDARWRSLFVEEPSVNLVPQIAGITTHQAENESDFFRLNGLVDYDANHNLSYFDLHVDHRLPHNFFYGLSPNIAQNTSGMGGSITIMEGLPDATSLPGSKSVYTDQHGFYSLSGLSPGLYNVSVFMEDKDFQESTFRPDANSTHVTQVLYVPGLPTLILESDQRGKGTSRMIWSKESRELARPARTMTLTEAEKILEGIGAGFRTEPQLVIIPHPENTSTGQPKLDVDVLIDGSLEITILDDFNTSKFNTNERFMVTYSSSISGVDFREDYIFSESDGDGWSGSGSALDYGQERLVIFPNDANGTNPVEVPLSSELTGKQSFTFEARAYEQNGTLRDSSNVSWQLLSDFNATEGNNSKLGTLSNLVGSSTDLTLFSKLQRGRVNRVKILASGSGYSVGSKIELFGEGVDFMATIAKVDSNGGITDLIISNRGSGYTTQANFTIEDIGGSNAVLQAVLGGGEIVLQATLGTLSSRVRVLASKRTELTEEEKWLDLFLDTIEDRNASWWNDLQYDLDLDGLTNLNEFNIGTHPSMADTDGDGLTDFNETTVRTNPLSRDTDGDGLFDGNESIIGTNPLHPDTDRDGYTDYEEYISPNLDPLNPDSLVNLSGVLSGSSAFSGDLYLKLEVGAMDSNVTPNIAIKLYENNESFVKLASNQLPQQFQYANLLAGKYYRLSGYIDINGNQALDSGEIYHEWEGLLDTNNADVELLFRNVVPDINFLDQYDELIQLAKGESFQLSLLATDYPDDNWTSPLIVNGPPVSRSIVLTGSALDVLQIANNQATVDIAAKFGTYSLFFTAYDLLETASVPLERQIVITDKADPVISVQSNPYPWPLGTAWDPVGLYSATDDPDGNITSDVRVNGLVDYQTIGQYPISLYVEDSFGRSTTKVITIEVADLSPPVIRFYEDEPTISWLLGQPFTLPENYVTASDNVDGDMTAQIEVSGLDQLDENTESNQTIYFSASDLAGNRVENQALTISFQPSTFTLSGLAIDGYLSGSLVEFKATNSEASNLNITAVTDENGSFNLAFLEEDFLLIDTNKNNVIDPEEGSIVVSGGVDTTTTRSFGGVLSADANSSIVSPLTTILSEMVKSGLVKSEAQVQLAESFGYSTSLDITTYDPIAAAKSGDSNTVAILQANALVVNTIKQITAMSEYSKLDSDASAIAMEIAGNMGDLIKDGALLKDSLQTSTTLEDLIEKTYNVIDRSSSLSDEDMSSFVSVLENSNAVLADSELGNYAPGEMLKKLSQKQIAVEEEVIEGISLVSQGTMELSTLQNNAQVASLQDLAEQILTVNNFSPEGKSFMEALGKSSFQMGEVVLQLDISDADGDTVSVSVVDESDALDVDGDNLAPLGVNNSYQLVVLDALDLETLLIENATLTLSLKLDDGNGKTTVIQGAITKSDSLENIGDATQRVNTNDYSLLDAVQSQETSWYRSSWFGDFYPGKDGWLYHATLGWLYLHSSGKNGFWIWDSYYDAWWWSSRAQNIFPYFYVYGEGQKMTGWGKFENLDSQTRVYEYFNKVWKER